jgi:hypothetical protein
MTNALTAGHH